MWNEGVTMEADPPSKKTNEGECRAGLNNYNLIVCVLCIVCASSSVVYNGWRHSVLLDRLSVLEDRVGFLEHKAATNVDVLVSTVKIRGVRTIN